MKCDNQTVKITENQESSQSIDNRTSYIPTSTFMTEFDATVKGIESEYKYSNNDQEKSIQCSQILYQHQVQNGCILKQTE